MNINIEKLLEELNSISINNLISLSDNEFREKILNLYNLTNDYTKFLYLELSKHERIQNFIKTLLIKKDFTTESHRGNHGAHREKIYFIAKSIAR